MNLALLVLLLLLLLLFGVFRRCWCCRLLGVPLLYVWFTSPPVVLNTHDEDQKVGSANEPYAPNCCT